MRYLAPPTSPPDVPMPLPELKTPEDKLHETINKYKISSRYVESMEFLKGMILHLVIDNSGSMATPIDSLSYVSFFIKPDGKAHRRRYDEAIEIVGMAIELGSHYFKSINVHFLNGIESQYGITNFEQIINVLRLQPNGGTPLVPVVKNILQRL